MKLRAEKVRTFLYWIEEREAIRLKRVAGQPAPWTKDEILATYRFCNVRRRDDRVSQWIINQILRPYAEHPNLWIMVAVSRHINWPDTMQEIMDRGLWPTSDDPDWRGIGRYVDQKQSAGEKAWTGAYKINPVTSANSPYYGYRKGKYIFEVVLKNLWKGRAEVTPQLNQGVEVAWDALVRYNGLGPFMAGQIVADYTYTSMLSNAPDLYTWAPLGPGSKRGLNRLLEIPLAKTHTRGSAATFMRELRETVLNKLGSRYADVTLHDVQNCLCEVDKYIRVKTGEGRPRSLYRSHA